MGQFLFSVVTIGVMIFAIVDIITSDEWRVKFLPKIAWVLLVIFLPIIGAVLWFVLGKERVSSSAAHPATSPAPAAAPVDIDAAVEAEIEFHEKQAEIRRLEARLREKRELEGE